MDETNPADAARAIGVLIRVGADVDEIRNNECVLMRLIELLEKSKTNESVFYACIKKALIQSKLDYEKFFDGILLKKLRVIYLDLYLEWIVYHRSEVEAYQIFEELGEEIKQSECVPKLLPACIERTFLCLAEKLIDFCNSLDAIDFLQMYRMSVRTGNLRTVEFAFQKLLLKTGMQQTLLTITVQEQINVKVENLEGYYKCFDAVLELHKNDVNDVTGNIKNSSLYYACKYDDDYIIHSLINANASLTLRNVRGEMAIEHISCKALRKYLDSCISSSLKFLKCLNNNNQSSSISNNHLFFDLSAFENKTTNSELDILNLITRKRHLNSLLCHPLTHTFIALKWNTIYPYLHVHQQCPILSIVIAIMIFFSNNDETSWNPMKIIIWLIGILSVLGEIIRLTFSGVKYFKSVTNYLNIASLSILFVYLAFPHHDNVRQLTLGIGSIVFAFNVTILMVYYVSIEMGIYLIMLIKVALNSMKFLGSIIFIIVGFSFSFYFTIGGNHSRQHQQITNDIDNDDTINNFTDVGISTFKTFVMITGELDASNIMFTNQVHLVIFAIFIFLIPIVSLNLLNGLAVDDIQVLFFVL